MEIVQEIGENIGQTSIDHPDNITASVYTSFASIHTIQTRLYVCDHGRSPCLLLCILS
jgi:hypothetical protein